MFGRIRSGRGVLETLDPGLTQLIEIDDRRAAMNGSRVCDGTCKPKCRECRQRMARQYRRENPHLSWVGNYRSRMRKYGLEDQIMVEAFTRRDVIFLYGNACVYCTNGEFEELDHVIPICHGGPHTLKNVRPSCAACNGRKSIEEGGRGDRYAG